MRTTRKKHYKQYLLSTQENSCHYCGVGIDWKLATIDHVDPKDNGGEDSLENFVLACHWCNQTKTNYPKDWFDGFMAYMFKKAGEAKYKKPKHFLSLRGFPIRKPNEQETGKWISRYVKLLKKQNCKIALSKVKSEYETSEPVSSDS